MWSTYIDPYNVFTRIGPEIRFISYSGYADVIAAVDNAEMLDYKKELLSQYQIMDDVDDIKFEASVRASLALAKLAAQYNIDTMVFNDIDPAMFRLIGLRAGFYHPWFNEQRSVLVPEADMGAGLITYILKLLSDKHVNFIEPFHIESAYGTFAGGHAGPNDHNDPGFRRNVVIARDVRFAKTNYKYAGAPFAWYRISPGRKTMAQLIECNGVYKLICTLVDSLEGEHLLATYSHSIFKPLVPVEKLFEQILKIGATQHFALVDGDYCDELRILADLMDFEFYHIQ
jgi:L-arabinose isomerase